MTTPARNSKVLPRRQKGLTLVEIMVAVTLGLILTAGLIQVFVSNKQVYRVQEGLARMQENGRFAIDFITRDVRGAGFVGCGGNSTPIVNTLNGAASYTWNFASAIQGSKWDSPTLDASITATDPPLAGDVLTVRRSVGDPVPVLGQTAGIPPGSAPITVAAVPGCPVNPPNPLCDFDTPSNPPPNPIAMISDCTNTAVFQITNTNPSSGTINHAPGAGTPGNATNALGKDFTDTAELVRLSTITYYIRPGVFGGPALWRKDGANLAQELVEGVEDMQILYGVDTDIPPDRVPNRYLEWDDAAMNFDNVVSVRIDLLLQSIDDNITNQPQTYTYNAATVTPADRRYRQVFGATIGLRNKIL